MRVMILIRSDEKSEAMVMPSEQVLAEMTAFNQEIADAGVMLSGEGLRPSSEGKLVRYSGGELTVTDGPTGKPGETIAGYWIWKVDTLDEAVAWVKRIPNPDDDAFAIEIRPLYENDDFGDDFPAELREQEARIRDQERRNAEG
jgi:hypothetical protein